tara:strand:+ start:12268 stop:12465 length:198 start_codon:yes stop_codon:yes gene_type:complete
MERGQWREEYEAHSLGAKRLTPAATDASIRFFCTVKAASWSLWTDMKDKTVWAPIRRVVSSVTDE